MHTKQIKAVPYNARKLMQVTHTCTLTHTQQPTHTHTVTKHACVHAHPQPSRPELNLTSPLVYAVRLNRVKCVEALLEMSTSLNVPDGFGVTPLQYAVSHGFIYYGTIIIDCGTIIIDSVR